MRVQDVCRRGDGWVEVDVSVSPRSSRPGPDGYDEWRRRMVLRVSAPPLDGRANAALAQFLARSTGVAKSAVELVSGQTSRAKRFLIRGVTLEAVIAALEPQ